MIILILFVKNIYKSHTYFYQNILQQRVMKIIKYGIQYKSTKSNKKAYKQGKEFIFMNDSICYQTVELGYNNLNIVRLCALSDSDIIFLNFKFTNTGLYQYYLFQLKQQMPKLFCQQYYQIIKTIKN
ncbi:hypothetical protein pb186bvf_018074 [Paramecium bursaria]